jgi:nudix-type nucleoside diphosphatase (YffH/AdpP family)
MSSTIKIRSTEVLFQSRYTLKKVSYETIEKDGTSKTITHEVYHRGDAAAILLYNKQQKTVILTKQLRLPSFLNGNPAGMLIEVCAGMLDGDNAEACARREAEEETGYKVADVQHAFDAYTSPGGLTEIIYCFVAAYTPDMKVAEGGGLAAEGEQIELLGPTLDEALHMIKTGEIKDAKTIMLLQYAKLHNLV